MHIRHKYFRMHFFFKCKLATMLRPNQNSAAAQESFATRHWKNIAVMLNDVASVELIGWICSSFQQQFPAKKT